MSLKLLILQHPQEPREPLSSAQLLVEQVAALAPHIEAKIATGLSWPNLKKASGLETVQPARWVVFYLGSHSPKVPLDWIGASAISDRGAEAEGLVILDGTWKQAKTLWWRNPWLLKLRRAALSPAQPSLYGEHRKEPRRECLSTFESGALALKALGPKDVVTDAWLQSSLDAFRAFVESKKWLGPRRPNRPRGRRPDRRRRF